MSKTEKRWVCACLLCIYLLGFHTIRSLAVHGNEIAITHGSAGDGITPMYYKPSVDAALLGEYFDGVAVSVLEYVSDEWAKVDIHTYGAGGNGYIMLKDLAFGENAARVKKKTVLYESTSDSFILSTHPFGQSGDLGPFGLKEQVELLGLVVRYEDNTLSQTYQRPLLLEQSMLHVKIGDITGFLSDDECLRLINQTE